MKPVKKMELWELLEKRKLRAEAAEKESARSFALLEQWAQLCPDTAQDKLDAAWEKRLKRSDADY